MESFAEGSSFNGNGRSVLQEGWPPWLVLVGRRHFVYIYLGGGHWLFSVPPLSAPTDLMDATGPPGVG